MSKTPAMRMRSRRSSTRDESAAVVTVADPRPDEAVAGLPPRRRGGGIVVGALVLAVLLVAAGLAARGRGNGDVLALGAVPGSTDLPPVEGDASAVDGVTAGAQSELAPGDSIPGAAPGAAPAADGGLPGATGAAGSPAAAGPVAAPGVATVAGGPVPTTRPAGTAITVPTSAPQPGGPPGPPPPCTVTDAAAQPNPVKVKGGSGRLNSDVEVRFRPVDCPAGASYEVLVNGLSLASRPVGNGFFSATIPGDRPHWAPGTYPITFTGATAAPTVSLRVEGR